MASQVDDVTETWIRHEFELRAGPTSLHAHHGSLFELWLTSLTWLCSLPATTNTNPTTTTTTMTSITTELLDALTSADTPRRQAGEAYLSQMEPHVRACSLLQALHQLPDHTHTLLAILLRRTLLNVTDRDLLVQTVQQIVPQLGSPCKQLAHALAEAVAVLAWLDEAKAQEMVLWIVRAFGEEVCWFRSLCWILLHGLCSLTHKYFYNFYS